MPYSLSSEPPSMTNPRQPLIRGSIPAIITPMFEDGRLDFSTLKTLIDWHIAEGSQALVVVGTTGESPTVSVAEHCELIKVAVEHANKRIPIIASTGGNSTSEAIELSEYALAVQADAILQVVPYYNKPSQEGLYRHFRTIAEKVDIPMILYNVPSRTVADISNETVCRLAQIPGVIGIKDATGQIDRGIRLIHALPKHFAVYSGDDATAIALMLLGAQGNISVTANIVPRLMQELCTAALEGNAVKARQIHFKLLPLHNALFLEANPVPVKWALSSIGKIQSGIRLPLSPLAAEYHSQLQSALNNVLSLH